MPLFVVQHRHPADRCPAQDKEMAPQLLKHLSKTHAETFGVKILSEAVLDGKHTLYLTVEAADSNAVTKYMEPFSRAGSVEVYPASFCETVVDRGFC
ncbi:MAG: sulfite oxidase [Ignavibacteriales bacterium]|nr:sulfite oxidase [Ignavibacteriales bacterium]